MKRSRKKNPGNLNANTNKAHNETNQNKRSKENVSSSPYMVSASLMLPVACVVIYYITSEPSITIHDKLEPLSPEVSGWQRANTDEEMKYNTIFRTIERRDAASLNYEEFERIYRYKKPLKVQFSITQLVD